MLETFNKIYWEYLNLVKIEQKYCALYVKTWVYFTFCWPCIM